MTIVLFFIHLTKFAIYVFLMFQSKILKNYKTVKYWKSSANFGRAR